MDLDPSPSGLLTQVKAMVSTVLSTMQNRGEIFLLELEEEKTNLIELLLWGLVVGLMGLMFLALFTLLIIWLFPGELRVYAVGGFCVLYLTGAIVAFLNVRGMLKRAEPPFSTTINELKKDQAWFDSSK